MPLLLPRHLPLVIGCGSRHLPLRCSARTNIASLPLLRLFSTNLQNSPSKTVIFALNSSGFRPPRRTLPIVRDIHAAPLFEETNISKRFELLDAKLKELGIQWTESVPGTFSAKTCPKCRGGEQHERSFSFFVDVDGKIAKWKCRRAPCGWTGSIQDGKVHDQTVKGKQQRIITEVELRLELLCEENFGATTINLEEFKPVKKINVSLN